MRMKQEIKNYNIAKEELEYVSNGEKQFNKWEDK